MNRFKEVTQWADDFVRDSKTGYVAGTPGLSLADISFATTYANLVAFEYFDLVRTFAREKTEFSDKLFSSRMATST